MSRNAFGVGLKPRHYRLVAVLLLNLLIVPGVFAADDSSPHRMLKPNGEADTEKCSACHNEDMSLSRSKVETCTLCHALTVHSGTAEHLRATAAAVSSHLPEKQPGALELPLTDEGQIYCGTCHLFHDPRVSNETALTNGRVRSSSSLAEAIRKSEEASWDELARTYGEAKAGAAFSSHSTRALRLPVDDGSLCRHCHRSATK